MSSQNDVVDGPDGLAGSADAEKLAALRRTKLAATTILVCCIGLFAAARLLEASLPGLGFVAAFAEAAAIGGIADWYAVVALFRRPMGLPIPHTAIIPANKTRIADNLGRFIEANFLAPGPIRAKLGEIDFAAMVSDWLADPRRSDGLARFITRLAPQAADAVEQSGLPRFLAARMNDQIEKVRLAPLAAELLGAVTAERRHQRLFDELIAALGRFLNDEQALAVMRDRVRDELPTLAALFRADAYLVRKIVASAGMLLDEARDDPDHPLRLEFDRFVARFIEQLRTSPDYAARAERLKRDFLARPEFSRMAEGLWQGLRAYVIEDAGRPNSRIREHLSGLLVNIGSQLAVDPKVRADMNAGFVAMLASFIDSQKSGVATFVAEQVKSWDLDQLTRIIEINIGRDLQYIRFNGMIVGGLAGLALHLGDLLLLAD